MDASFDWYANTNYCMNGVTDLYIPLWMPRFMYHVQWGYCLTSGPAYLILGSRSVPHGQTPFQKGSGHETTPWCVWWQVRLYIPVIIDHLLETVSSPCHWTFIKENDLWRSRKSDTFSNKSYWLYSTCTMRRYTPTHLSCLFTLSATNGGQGRNVTTSCRTSFSVS